MDIQATAIAEVKLIKPARFGDHRGYFSEVYNQRALAEAGIDIDFVQDNQSFSAERGTLRGLARERKRVGGGPEQAFELIAHADGRLTLRDPVTARRIDLASFGPINASGFAELLRAGQVAEPATALDNPTVTSQLATPRPQ